MKNWQQQGYLDRAIWQSKLFTTNALSPQNTSSEASQYGMISCEESRIFKDLRLEKKFWIPRICKIFQIKNFSGLKEIESQRVMNYLEQFKDINPSKRHKLISLFAELKCLYFPPLEIKKITYLPNIFKERKVDFMNNRDDDDEAKFKDLVRKLESTIWDMGKCSKLSYEHLACIATLTLFGFDLDVSFFKAVPNGQQLDSLFSMLNENLENLKSFYNIKQKQAYVLKIDMSNCFENAKVVPYILKQIPDKIPKELSFTSYGEKELTGTTKGNKPHNKRK